MAESFDAQIAAVGAQHNLGARVDTYRSHRPVRILLLWISALAGAVLALVAFVVDVSWLGYIAIPLAVLGVVTYARLLPPPAGRRSLVVFDQGFVEASDAGLRPVRWSDIESVTPEPGPAGGMTIVYRTGDAAESGGHINIDALGGRRLLHMVETRMRWRAIQHARAELLDHGRAAFAPVVITPTGLELDATDQRLPWERLARVTTTAERLVVNTTDANGLLVAWFDGPVPHASACAALIKEINPHTRGPATILTDRPAGAEVHPLRKHLVGLAVLALVIPIGYAVYARLFLPDRRSGSPIAGYAAGACGARRVAFRWTPRYQGAKPHPIVAYNEVPNQPLIKSSFPDVPDDWRPQTPALTQLIACARIDPATTNRTSAVQTCHGHDTFGGVFGNDFQATLTFYQAGYQVDVYEARTGRTVGSAHLQPTTVACPDTWQTYKNSVGAAEDLAVPIVPTAADYREALRKYVE